LNRNSLIWGQTIKGQVYEAQKYCRRGSQRSCGYRRLLVTFYV